MTDTTITHKETEPIDFCSFDGCGGPVAYFGEICGFHKAWVSQYQETARQITNPSLIAAEQVVEYATTVANGAIMVPARPEHTHVHGDEN